jgi:DNA helicase II / ATP-dependent DNA helicase PcrA
MQELVVDLHVHSHFSRATSKNCDVEGLYRWGKLKGINVIGTGDFTHPEWFAEIGGKLEMTEGGLYRLREDIAKGIDKTLLASVRNELIRFVPTVEIAAIYSKGGRVRKLHQLVVMPDLASAGQLNERLERIGNLKADGRPILGVDSKELLRHTLEVNPDGLYIPAHIWTPWFGMFGSKSGFDSIEEAFEELAPEIKAIETGLSSDPFMNWQLDQLKNLAIISNSDAHSPQKLGREATIIQAEPTYQDVIGAIKTNDRRLTGTIEFFPEEGKYHADGHRVCGVRFSPEQTKQHGGICPKCGKPLVVGVEYRVAELADRLPKDVRGGKRVEYIVPLTEVIAELRGVKSTSGKAVQAEYMNLVSCLGSEFDILRKIPLAEISAHSPLIALAVERIRKNQVHRDPGYDGVFGTIKIFESATGRQATLNQISLL